MALSSVAPGLETPLVMVVVMVTVLLVVMVMVLLVVMDLPSLSGTSHPHRKGLSPFQNRTMKGLREEGT